jgi:uncharacterized repeat protein (TIGR01451 family)
MEVCMKNKKTWSRIGWWQIGVRLSLISILSATLALGSLFATPSPVQAAERRVCASGCPYTFIQAAIDAAISGDTIKVAQGTYYEKLYITKAVTLTGGYWPPNWTTPNSDPSLTVINATGQGDSAIWVNWYGASGTTIENFTITGGTGHFYSSRSYGGGIEVTSATVTIRNNIIQGNSADEGGGICIADQEGTPLYSQILNNVITGNEAVRTNGSGWGGGISLDTTVVTVKDNVITNNTAYWGAGFHIWRSIPTIENNIISGNQALGSEGVGGAFFIEDSSAFIKNNIIFNNVAQKYGDGIYIKIPYGPQPQIVNNTIVANKYSDSGTHEGILVRDNVSPIIRNNIIALNGIGIRNYPYDTPAYPILSHNDVWGNSVADYSDLSPGTNDISADPLFVNQSGGDYHLQGSSPCIDTGTSSDAPPTDFEGGSRPLDGNGDGSAQYDIGADEYAMWIAKRASPSSADPGDYITYVITYRNNDENPASGVVITDILSPDLLNPNFTYSGASITRRGGTTYVWDVVGNLNPGSGGTITITAQIDPSVVTPTSIPNTAEFYAASIGSFSERAPLIVGGLETYLPTIFKGY